MDMDPTWEAMFVNQGTPSASREVHPSQDLDSGSPSSGRQAQGLLIQIRCARVEGNARWESMDEMQWTKQMR